MQKLLITILLVLCCSPAWGFGWSSAGGSGKRINLTVSGWAAQGEWSAATTYTANDVVTHNGSTWTAIQGGVNHEPTDGSLYWLKSIAQGNAATVSAGTVTQLEHGQSPTVTNAGNSGAAVFNFGIPAGAPGAAGADGRTVLTTSGAPSAGTGANGDYAYDPATYLMYGPKSGGAWPNGVLLKGADGAGFTGGTDGTYGWLTDSNTSSYSECASGKYGLNFVGGVLYQCSNGTNSVFTSGDSLPSQTGNSGKYLTTNGTVASWGTIAAGGGITISTDIPTEEGVANLNDTTHVLTVASSTGYTQFTGSFTAWDTTPDAFSFTDETGIAISTAKTSNAITVAGINAAAAISVTGDTGFGYSKNSAACTATSGTVVAGDTVAACVTSSGSNSTATTATVTIGGVSDTYSVTTAAGESGYSDSFTGTDGTSLATHDANWTSINSTYNVTNLSINNNMAQTAASSSGGAYYNSSNADVSQIVVKGVSQSILKRATVRASTDNLGYSAAFYYSSGQWTKIAVYKNGTFAAYIGTLVLDATVDHTLRITASGTTEVTISVYANNNLVGTYNDTSSTITSGHPGFYLVGASNTSNNLIDEWRDY